MTQDQFLTMLGKRLANGLNPSNMPKNIYYERMMLISLVLRVREVCPLVSFRAILRYAFLNQYKIQPRKDQTKAIMDFYPLLMATFGDKQLPYPLSLNLKQNEIMEYFKEKNALILEAIDPEQQLTKDARNEAARFATDEAKIAIKEAGEMAKERALLDKKRKAEEEKEQRSAAAKALRKQLSSPDPITVEQIAQQKEKMKAYEDAVKKQRRTNTADTNTRSKAADELDAKIHQLYIERHGEDTDKIPISEYRLLQAIVHRETEEKKQRQERERAEHIRRMKRDAVMTVSHQTRLHLNNQQKAYLQKCFGIARFCFNWAYDEWVAARERGERPFASELEAKFIAINKEQYPWTYEVTHFAKHTGFKAFEKAQNAFFNGSGFPQRKRHGIGTGSLNFVVSGDRKEPSLLDYNPDIPNSQPSKKRQYLFVPGLGYVKMMERIRFEGLLTSATIRLKADGHYYASLLIHIPEGEWQKKHRDHGIRVNNPLGIDLGVKDLAILSNGLCIDKRPEDERLQKRKKELQKAIYHRHDLHPNHTSKKQKQLKWQLAKVKARISRQREDYIHKVTSALAYTYNNICMENLNVADMMKDGKAAAGRILDAGFYRFRELMEEKMAAASHTLHVADKFFPSTRTCSQCGCVQEQLTLEQRVFYCPDCGLTIDRDLNAAINLAKLIGMGEPNLRAADKGAIAAILQMSGVTTHQATEEKQAGLQT